MAPLPPNPPRIPHRRSRHKPETPHRKPPELFGSRKHRGESPLQYLEKRDKGSFGAGEGRACGWWDASLGDFLCREVKGPETEAGGCKEGEEGYCGKGKGNLSWGFEVVVG